MCIARCTRCLGITLVPLAVVSMLANTLLLFPDLQIQYLLEGHVTKYAIWVPGLWASGFLVLLVARAFISSGSKKDCCGFRSEMLCSFMYVAIAVAGASFCFLMSGTGLAEGPLCKFNVTLSNGNQSQVWGTPLELKNSRDKSYLFDQSRWEGVCEEPRGVVLWNMVLFSVLMASSGLQAVICAVQAINAVLGLVCGPGFRKNKVGPM
ncbi:transmembrane 4 L6 family member 1 [Amia ocellicauda]|uniref:transmembrane 4 L6 family member 1 n=1 Tax=Amia ocellicauda TaxID=2972642 RepID=UPI0034642984